MPLAQAFAVKPWAITHKVTVHTEFVTGLGVRSAS
jgi:hypothetical protein